MGQPGDLRPDYRTARMAAWPCGSAAAMRHRRTRTCNGQIGVAVLRAGGTGKLAK